MIENYNTYSESLSTATPWSVNGAIDKLIRIYDDFDRLEDSVGRFIRASGKGLDNAVSEEIPSFHYLSLLLRENEILERKPAVSISRKCRFYRAIKGYVGKA